MNEVQVRLLPFHNPKFHEAVSENEDGSYTVIINANMASNKVREAYDHALRHINGGDFEKADVQEIEHEAHKD